ncbi:TDT family transporter [Pelagibaculum spongiae]|uniref:TDT family transporter n=1 Tax=Pelagibaculum spongiae TaxID=2080658 RepID=UPI001F4D7F27|nr:TDT family transporter [Pelagibaculum spongiae]
MKEKLAKYPTPSAGLALAIGSLGWCWENALPLNGMAQLASAIVAAIIVMLIFAKFVTNPKVLWSELAHPVIGSVIPTFAMASMVISASLVKFSPQAGAALWYLAVTSHLIFLSIFSFNRIKVFKLIHMVPSWFVPPVGLVVAVLTLPNAAAATLANGLLIFGISCYFVMLPMMLYRLIFAENITDTAKPTIAIMAAPPSLCLAGYLSFIEQPHMLLVLALLGIAILMTMVIYMAFLHLLRLPFSPGYAAFTFPMVISATALFKARDYIATTALSAELAQQLKTGAMVELFIATLVVGYVSYRYLAHFNIAGIGNKPAPVVV